MDEKLIESAKNYYALALINILSSLSDDYRSHETVFRQFVRKYAGSGDDNESVHSTFFLMATRTLIDRKYLEIISSEFSPPYLRKTANFADAPSIPEVVDLTEKYERLGSSGENWLRSTFQTIGNRFDGEELFEYAKKWLDERNRGSSDVVSSGPETLGGSSSEDDEWEPLKIERASEAYKEAIDSSEAAIREIETSNGYAASEPEERNAIVASSKGTLDAIKNGFPSKQAIRQGLLSPLRFVAKKFADTTIGEIAKIAVTKLVAWLAGLG